MPYFAELHEAVSQMDLYRWMTHVRLSRLIGFLLILLGLVSLVTHYYLSDIGADLPDGGVTYRSRTKLDHVEDLHSVGDLRFQIDELRRIKASVNNELRELESRRQKLHGEISAYNTEIENLKGQHERTSIELQQLKMLIENTKLEQEELVRRTMPDIRAPRRLLPDVGNHAFLPTPKSPLACRMHNCFDYSRCSLTSQFPVYVYNLGEYSFAKAELDSFITVSVTHAFDASPHMTLDPNIACLFVVVIGDVKGGIQSISGLAQKLQQLPFWRGDGRNHLLVNIARRYNNKDVFAGQNTGRALIAQSTFSDLQYRNGYDIIIPPSLGISHGDVWDQLPPLVPAWRKYILSFLGDYQFLNPALSGEDKNRVHIKSSELSQPPYRNHVVAPPGQAKRFDEYLNNGSVPTGRKLQGIETPGSRTSNTGVHDLLMMENVIVETLKDMQSRHSSDGFHFQFLCPGERIFGLHAEWALCGPDSMRQDVLKQSTFSLIIAPTNSSVISTVLTQVRIYEALRFGAIPVILGEYVHLPFADELLWRQASVVLPKARVTELHYYLRAFSDSHVLDMRKQGRLFWETHFGTSKTIVDTLLAVIRRRLNIPAFPVREEASTSVFNSSFVPLKDENSDAQAEGDDILGPVEPPLASPRFQHNFSYSIQTFSTPGDPFHLYPFSPFQPPMPGEAKFLGSGFGFRPIGKGAGGSGKEFNEALGGNYPREQFTIVMLTYERESVLINAVSRLKGLPHLNKVIVVWNSPKAPADDLRWPDIGVNIHVIRTSKNSLNNRFLPYDAIETEAILSIDDDAHLRHDEIIFGFRVWREARERIVGFPGRFHAWDLKQQSWLYNSNYSCELSMVLTGAAFFHKYYAYLYSYVMPQAIRDKVDEYLNCEDLAMNFLVSHITRQAPIKVTSRWTFRCPGCPKALSVEDEHFTERHKCINFFVKIYGYMPLLYTQFRVDSVLFKTRIPHDKQKCFKFI